jgi:CHAT domain-containing protein
VSQFMGFFADRNRILNQPALYAQQAYTLYRQLFPFAMDGVTRLQLVPDDCLNNLPFEALVTKPPTGNQLSQWPYLLQTQSVELAFSARILLQQNGSRENAGDYLYIAAPGFAQKERGLTPLPASTKEARGIEEAANGHTSRVEAGEATVQDFLTRAGDYRILHLSTHASSEADSLNQPQIEFTDSSLSLPALYAMRLKAGLVVLSACKTNLGKFEKGEGVMSLSRGFSYAGAQTMIASLWEVDDAASADLFRDFYQQLGQHSIASSLRAAKKQLIRSSRSDLASPYYWAGFQFIGQDTVIEQPFYGRWVWVMVAVVLLSVSALWWRYRKRKS